MRRIQNSFKARLHRKITKAKVDISFDLFFYLIFDPALICFAFALALGGVNRP